MGILKEIIQGTKIICEVKSSNFKRAEYDTATKHLIIEFIYFRNFTTKKFTLRF